MQQMMGSSSLEKGLLHGLIHQSKACTSVHVFEAAGGAVFEGQMPGLRAVPEVPWNPSPEINGV